MQRLKKISQNISLATYIQLTEYVAKPTRLIKTNLLTGTLQLRTDPDFKALEILSYSNFLFVSCISILSAVPPVREVNAKVAWPPSASL